MYGLKNEIIDQIKKYGGKYNLRKIVLFGSRARGDYRERSDVDLAVYGADKSEESRIYFDIDDSVDTLLKFDVVFVHENISEELLVNIRQDGVVLYEKK